MNYKGFLDSWKVTMNLRLEHIMCTIVITENVVQLKKSDYRLESSNINVLKVL